MKTIPLGHYGWVPDVPDFRDHVYALAPPVALPPALDLRTRIANPAWWPVTNQGQIGSCVAHAVGAAIQYEQIMQQVPVFAPSPLFIYYNARRMENTVTSDPGCQIRNGIKTVTATGACPEADWPYVIAKIAVQPPTSAYTRAPLGRVLSYARVLQTLTNIKTALVNGDPVVLGLSVYQSFEAQIVADTGIAPLPQAGEIRLGGHAVLVVGYNDAAQSFLLRNSWGVNWGQAGYFALPYAYLTNPNLCDDLWVIKLVAG